MSTLSKKSEAAKLSAFFKLPDFLRTPWAIAVCVLLLIAVPFYVKNMYILHIMNFVLYYIVLAVSLDMQVGLLGLLNFGHIGFAAIGSYSVAILTTSVWRGEWWGFWAAFIIGGLLAGAVGLLVGLTTFRIRGDFFCIVTLGFGEITRFVALNWISLTNGPMGIPGILPPRIIDTTFSRVHFYWLVLAMALFTIVLVYRLTNSYVGRAWIAMREDSLAAESMGVNLVYYKVLNIAISAGLAGLAGGFFAAYLNFISPLSFLSNESLNIMCMVILGGKSSIVGAVTGASILTVLPEILRPVAQYRLLFYGVVMLLFMIFRPKGVFGK